MDEALFYARQVRSMSVRTPERYLNGKVRRSAKDSTENEAVRLVDRSPVNERPHTNLCHYLLVVIGGYANFTFKID